MWVILSKGAKMDCSDRHQDDYCHNASAAKKLFLSSLSFAITHNLFQYLIIIRRLKNAKGGLATSPYITKLGVLGQTSSTLLMKYLMLMINLESFWNQS